MRNYYYNSIVLEMTDNPSVYIRVSANKVFYFGPWAVAKGDSVAKQNEAATAQFDQQLMQIFQSQYQTQQAQLKYLQGKMQPIIDKGGQGYTPEQLAAMRTSATDTNSQQYQNAQAALNNEVTQASGGSKLSGVSGAVAESDAALLDAAARQQAGSQNQITQANASLQQQNYWNAINVLNGVAAQENPQSYASESNSAGGTVAGLSQAVTAANQSQLLGALGGVAGGVGAALGGGFSKGGLFGCWIAAEIFGGWFKEETIKVRNFIFGKFAKTWYGSILAKNYTKHGQWAARKPAIVWALTPLFKMALQVSE